MASSVKTAISIRADLLKKVTEVAREINVSRSKLFSMAVDEFIRGIENEELFSRINEAFDEQADEEELKYQRRMKRLQKRNLSKESW